MRLGRMETKREGAQKKEIERIREKGSKMETEQRNGDREIWMREVRKAEVRTVKRKEG